MFSYMFPLFQLLLLVFSQNRFLLIYQRQYIVHAPPCFWNRMRGFLKARRSWEPGSSITTVEFSLFRLLRKASAVNVHWTEHDSYLSFSQKSSSWNFLALAKLRSTAQVRNHQRISKLVNRLIVACLMTASSCFTPRRQCGPSSLRMLRSGIFNVPMPYGIYCMSHDSFLRASLQGDSADLPCYNASQRDLQPA